MAILTYPRGRIKNTHAVHRLSKSPDGATKRRQVELRLHPSSARSRDDILVTQAAITESSSHSRPGPTYSYGTCTHSKSKNQDTCTVDATELHSPSFNSLPLDEKLKKRAARSITRRYPSFRANLASRRCKKLTDTELELVDLRLDTPERTLII